MVLILHNVSISAAGYIFVCSETTGGFQIFREVDQNFLPATAPKKLANQHLVTSENQHLVAWMIHINLMVVGNLGLMLHTIAISAAPYLFLCSETAGVFQILQIFKAINQDLLPAITDQKLAKQFLREQTIH